MCVYYHFLGKEMKIELLRQGNKITTITDDKYYDFDTPLLYKWVNIYHFNALDNPSVNDFSVSNQAKTNKQKTTYIFYGQVSAMFNISL